MEIDQRVIQGQEKLGDKGTEIVPPGEPALPRCRAGSVGCGYVMEGLFVNEDPLVLVSLRMRTYTVTSG